MISLVFKALEIFIILMSQIGIVDYYILPSVFKIMKIQFNQYLKS